MFKNLARVIWYTFKTHETPYLRSLVPVLLQTKLDAIYSPFHLYSLAALTLMRAFLMDVWKDTSILLFEL